jgi:hypothetical protein
MAPASLYRVRECLQSLWKALLGSVEISKSRTLMIYRDSYQLPVRRNFRRKPPPLIHLRYNLRSITAREDGGRCKGATHPLLEAHARMHSGDKVMAIPE